MAQTRFFQEIETRVWMPEVFICDYNKGIYNVDKKYELAEPSFQEMRRVDNRVDAPGFQVSWKSTIVDLWPTRHLVPPCDGGFRYLDGRKGNGEVRARSGNIDILQG